MSLSIMHDVFHVPDPPSFQCVTLKAGNGPGDEAMPVHQGSCLGIEIRPAFINHAAKLVKFSITGCWLAFSISIMGTNMSYP